ncbi:MAG: sugar transferase [Candidatus Promineifilaceae bacterium]
MIANPKTGNPLLSSRVSTANIRPSDQTQVDANFAWATIDSQPTETVATRFSRFAKRTFDATACVMILPFVLPVMAAVAAAIKLDSKGGVLFHQTRVGQNRKSFTCYKFRSMRIDAEEIKARLMAQNEADGPVFKMKQDPRITRVGRFIRKYSLDELPQIFNVLFGDMSLVGPRPAIPSEVEQYTPYQEQRLAVVPGLTGLQQVSGRSDLDFEQWVEFDLQYIREKGLRKDIEILFRTIPAVISGKGAY